MNQPNSRTILAVDSDARTRTLLEITLTAEGYNTYVVGEPDAAFEILELFPDIVIFDDVTFGPTTSDFIAYARSLEPHPDMIFMTTRDDAAARARSLGIRISIVKPFDPTRLFRLVTQCPRFTPTGTQIAPAVGFTPASKKHPIPKMAAIGKQLHGRSGS